MSYFNPCRLVYVNIAHAKRCQQYIYIGLTYFSRWYLLALFISHYLLESQYVICNLNKSYLKSFLDYLVPKMAVSQWGPIHAYDKTGLISRFNSTDGLAKKTTKEFMLCHKFKKEISQSRSICLDSRTFIPDPYF